MGLNRATFVGSSPTTWPPYSTHACATKSPPDRRTPTRTWAPVMPALSSNWRRALDLTRHFGRNTPYSEARLTASAILRASSARSARETPAGAASPRTSFPVGSECISRCARSRMIWARTMSFQSRHSSDQSLGAALRYLRISRLTRFEMRDQAVRKKFGEEPLDVGTDLLDRDVIVLRAEYPHHLLDGARCRGKKFPDLCPHGPNPEVHLGFG